MRNNNSLIIVKSIPPDVTPLLSVFSTELGWLGLAGVDQTVLALSMGHTSADQVRAVLTERLTTTLGFPESAGFTEQDWSPELRQRLIRFGQGEQVLFDDVPILVSRATSFQESVLNCTRMIGYGETVSYGELAKAAGSPRAARAIGNVMAGNPVPILIPCHRVLAAGGRIGGFSAPQGIALKERMLALEAGERVGAI